MFRKILVFCIAFILTSCTTHHISQISHPSLPEMGKEATVAFVISPPEDDSVIYPYCTGVWINKDTILTALHCARHAATVAEIKKAPPKFREIAELFTPEVKDPTGAEMDYIIESEVSSMSKNPKSSHQAKVLAIDPAHDLALITANKLQIPDHIWLHVSDTMPNVGDKVYVIGHPAGLYFSFFDGMVSAIRMNEEIDMDETEKLYGPFVQVFSGIWHGNSGGAVINEKGEIIGIVSFMLRAPNQGFCIATPSIKQFIIKTYDQHLLP